MICKRLFDIFFSALVLFVIWPVFVFVSLLVRLDSPGPIFFCQIRVGRGGRLFHMYKFRSMRVDNNCASTGLQVTADRDVRITRVGAIIRRLKIDELPQFINVIKGDMSVVGPRPEVPRYVAFYSPASRDVLLSVRPGITDPVSLIYRNESLLLAGSDDPDLTYIDRILPEKIRLSEQCVLNRSFFGDLLVIAKTAFVCIR